MTGLKDMVKGKFMAWMPALLVLLFPLISFAGGGDDHSHGNEVRVPVVTTATGGLRLELKSQDIEILGMLHDGELTLYADRYATNEPLHNATIELESNGQKVQARTNKDGTYTVAANWLTQPGKHDVVVSIEAGDLHDLLIGTLDIPPPTLVVSTHSWPGYAKWTALGAVVLLALIVLLRTTRRGKGVVSVAALPLIVAILFSSHGIPASAHGDEDHSDKSKTTPVASTVNSTPATVQAPVRQPDGSIFMPKPAQRLLGIRTILGKPQDIAQTFELNGRVIANPNFSGRIQSSQSGRIAAPAGGFPTIGMKVSKGQVLAYIEPAANNIDKGNQQAQLAELTSNLILAENRAQRLEQLEGSVPQKEIDAARAEAVSLKARKAAVANSLSQTEALRSPVSGVISLSSVVAGQMVEGREILFEVINPSMLWIEAVAYDTALSGQVAGATAMTAGNQPLTLAFIGQSHQLREQALSMQFAVKPPFPLLSVGQPVKVFAQTRQALRGISVPPSSVMKNSSGESIVWLHASAERFVPQKVKVQALDASTVAVLEGLHDGARVVTQGAALLTQIR